jgi:hypothetical protein
MIYIRPCSRRAGTGEDKYPFPITSLLGVNQAIMSEHPSFWATGGAAKVFTNIASLAACGELWKAVKSSRKRHHRVLHSRRSSICSDRLAIGRHGMTPAQILLMEP